MKTEAVSGSTAEDIGLNKGRIIYDTQKIP
jgi:hypothetical protein